MRLKTLGDYELSPLGLRERTLILILSYLSLEGETPRHYLASLLWPQAKLGRRNANLAEALRRLRKISGQLVTGGNTLKTSLRSDWHDVLASDNDAALKLYRGPFLAEIESSKRFKLGEELSEWLFNKREQIANHVLNLKLRRAEQLGLAAKFNEAASIANELAQSKSIAYPAAAVYERLHLILLADERLGAAEELKNAALELYDAAQLRLLSAPAQARLRLAHAAVNTSDITHYLGRDEALKEVVGLLTQQTRLVTVLGQGGIGKTGFVKLLLARVRGEAFCRSGIFIVYLEELAAIADTQDILRKILAELHPGLKKDRFSAADIVKVVNDDPVLLALDNAEHLLPKLTEIVAVLLEGCPRLKVVLSSRQTLGLQSETIFNLPAFTFPADVSALTLENSRGYSAVHLFTQLAEQKDSPIEPHDLPSVATICQLVEGLPLALHLSAGWLNTLSPEQIASQLADNLKLLSRGYSDTPRHQSIQAAFNHSLNLLSAPEKTALTNLAVFAGSFDSDAAEAVAQLNLFGLRALVEKSLLRFDKDEQRYSFHPLLKRLLHEDFIQEGNAAKLKTAHATYYLDRLAVLFSEDNKEDDLTNLLPESGEIAAAWRFATDETWTDRILVLAKALQRYASLSGRYSYGEELLTYTVEKIPTTGLNLRAVLYSNLSLFKWYKNDYEAAIRLATEAAELLDESDMPDERRLSVRRLALGVLLSCYSESGEYEKSLEIAKHLNDIALTTTPESPAHVGALVEMEITRKEARGIIDNENLEKALSLAKRYASFRIPQILCLKAECLVEDENFEEALDILERAHELAEKFNLKRWAYKARRHKAYLSLKQNMYWLTKDICLGLLKEFDDETPKDTSANIFCFLAQAEQQAGNFKKAEYCFDKALSHAAVSQSRKTILQVKVALLDFYFKTNNDHQKTLVKALAQNEEQMDYPSRRYYRQVLG